MLVFLKFRFVA